jgi:uncharacterized protein (TIGR03083 family)
VRPEPVPGLAPPSAIDVRGLFAPDRRALLALLESLAAEEWSVRTACTGWDVRDVALHLLGGDLANISGRRDGQWALLPARGEPLGAFINRINEEWVASARRLSPRLIHELLEFSGPILFQHLESLDQNALGGPVSWAGPEPAPVWLDVAREYMERWVHQQHIRQAVGRPGQNEVRFVEPVIAASMHAVPRVMLADRRGSLVIDVRGEGGGAWTLIGDRAPWSLWAGSMEAPDCLVSIAVEDWWRLVTLGITSAEALARVEGDPALGEAALTAVAIIA